MTALTLVGLLALGSFPRVAFTKDDRRTTGAPPPLPAPEEEFQRVLAEAPPAPAPLGPELPPPPGLPVVGGAWVAQGPGPIRGGQTEGMGAANSPVAGAIQAIVADPGNADILYVGAVNGGIWKTMNATNASPTWTPLGDAFASLSIGAMTLDPLDGTNKTLVAGRGRFSSFSFVGGPRVGLVRTTDGGSTWTALNGGGTLTGKNISGVAPHGATIVVSVNIADSFTCANIGIFRSTDTGGSFTQISAVDGVPTGLPQGRAFDLVRDPTNHAVLYTAIRDATSCNLVGTNGVYMSSDTGATWVKVSSAAMDTLMASSGINNTRIAVGMSGQVYAGIIVNGQLAGLFRSPALPNALTWTQLDTPTTNEGGTVYGIQPQEKPGSQGSIHFSIVADPTDANIVYVGGDRQPGSGDTGASFPNSIYAFNYTGRLFRVNAGAVPGTQATPLTHCQVVYPGCNGSTSTTNNSAPHADSRRMVFDAAGNIIESDDGGIFRRTNPRATGDWFSVNGNLQVTEAHDVAYDTVSNMIMTGNQDNGTSEQRTSGMTTWDAVFGGDGGDVAVDDISSGTQSKRYSSSQNLGFFQRRTVDNTGVTTLSESPALTLLGGSPPLTRRFVTPIEVNRVDATRMLIAGSNDLYESLDRGDSITALGLNQSATAMVYGGKSGLTPNPALIYAISGANVYVRLAGAGPPLLTTSPMAGTLRDVAVDPSDPQKAYVINSSQVFSTVNAGSTWTEVTGNLGSGGMDLRSIVFVPGTPSAIVVGGLPACNPCPDRGSVFRMATGNVGVWNQFGSGMPNAPVWDMVYDPADDVLVAGTMGRGAWKLSPVGNLNTPPMITPAAPLTRQAGSPATVSTIATVSDAESPAGSLVVTTTSMPMGILVTNITNTNGTVTANVAAACVVALGANTVGLRVTDPDGATADANLTVNVNGNTAPTLGTYPGTSVVHNGGTTVTPDAAPTDNGSVVSLMASAPGFTGTLSGNTVTGVITISNAGPAGNFTVTVTATDNCGATTQRTFSLQVTPVANLSITKTDGQSLATPGQTMTYTIVAGNSGPDSVTGATVSDTVPGTITGATWTCVGAGGGSCTANGMGNISDNAVNLPMGGTATYTLTGTLSMAAFGSVSNTATIAAPGGVTDPNLANNTATDTDGIAVSCGAPDLLIFPDGRLTTMTIGAGATMWFRVVLTVDRSYSAELTNRRGDATVPGTMTVLRGNDICGASSLVTRDTSDIDPRMTAGAARQSFRTPGDDIVYHIRVVNGSGTPIESTIAVSDTTMYSPAWTTNGTFDTYYAFQNTTNALISGTLTLLDQTGATVQTLAINNIPVGGIFGTNTVSLGVIRNRVGNARFIHDGPPGAVQIKADMANFAQTPPFIQSVLFEAKREKRK